MLSDTFSFSDLMGDLLVLQLKESTRVWEDMFKWLKEHPPIKSPLYMVCGRPWWIWYDELGDPIRFQWVEDRLNLNV